MAHNKISKEERARKRTQIVTAHESNGDWRQVSRELSVPISTAYRWVQQGDQLDRRGGRRYNKITGEHREHMVQLIEANPRITLGEIAASISEIYSVSVSNPTIATHLDAMTYTLKTVRFEREKANCLENKIKRKAFVKNLLEVQAQNVPIVFMDETNLNIYISRTEGRSVRGSRCTTVAGGSKGANVHVIGAISNLGIVHYELKRGSFKKENAQEWIKTCLRKAVKVHGGPVVLIVDNAPCHSGVEEVLQIEEFNQCRILRLAPYSPMFNPIENIWSIVKSKVRRNLAAQLARILNQQSGTLSMREQRLRALENLMDLALQTITPAICTSCIASIQSKVSMALNLEDMRF